MSKFCKSKLEYYSQQATMIFKVGDEIHSTGMFIHYHAQGFDEKNAFYWPNVANKEWDENIGNIEFIRFICCGKMYAPVGGEVIGYPQKNLKTNQLETFYKYRFKDLEEKELS